ncbi:hypothetical protein ACFQ0M_17255 [Kitasatospora aburaviensis]
MTANGRFLGVVRDELATASDVARQAVAGVDPSTSMYRANMRRLDATADLGALTTQVMTSVPVYLRRGDVVTSISVRSGATAAGTPPTGGSPSTRTRQPRRCSGRPPTS